MTRLSAKLKMKGRSIETSDLGSEKIPITSRISFLD